MGAFDHLEKLVDRLVDCGKTQQWAREVKQQLRLPKQYLKGDYTELFLTAGKVGSAVWTDLFDLASSRYQTSQCQQKGIGVQTVRDFNVYSTNNQTRKNNSVSLYKTSPTLYLKGTKVVDT